MSETLAAKMAAAAKTAALSSEKSVGIRVSPNAYLSALFFITFFAGWLVYLEISVVGLVLFTLAWLTLPILAWSDRITFDGRRLIRTGFLPRLWASVNNSKERLKINDIEQVESQSLRALKRGGNVFYRYRTTVQGRNRKFVFASGGEEYRQMIRRLFSVVPENILDNRSIELRDFLADPKEVLMKAEFAKIPSAEVLESSKNEFRQRGKKIAAKYKNKFAGEEEIEKADYLHRLANELRLAGYLLQSLETFRRALILNPQDAHLIFDFARCLHSFGGSEHNDSIERRAIAALRLAEKYGRDDADLLARLGESYFQYGNLPRARAAFNQAIEMTQTNFRSIRGLAEIALREGKIAHVIHHFTTANRLADSKALRRWTQTETVYFSRLNDDDEYMEMEISRVNMLESFERYKKTALQIALFGLAAILFGLVVEDDLITDSGWVIAAFALIVRAGLMLGHQVFATRVPVELEFDDEE